MTQYFAYSQAHGFYDPRIWRTAVTTLTYSEVVMLSWVSVYALKMATLVELQKEIHEGLAVRRPSYPEWRFVWDRGDGLLVTSGQQGRIISKPFSMEEILADDWVPVPLPMFTVQRNFELRIPKFHRKRLPKPMVPMRDIPAMLLALLVVGALGFLVRALL